MSGLPVPASPRDARPRRIGRSARRIGRLLLIVLGLYLVFRGLFEIFTVDPAKPETYRLDWGGPHYLGVMLVHAGPGGIALLAFAGHRRRRARGVGSRQSMHRG